MMQQHTQEHPTGLAAPHPQSVTILGVTGSIGETALGLLRLHRERFTVTAITAQKSWQKLVDAALEFMPEAVAIGDETCYLPVKNALAHTNIRIFAGAKGVQEAAALQSDIVLSAIVGAAGLVPTLTAIERGARVALANKESLVCAGELMQQAVRRHGAELIPVDSEHSALFQSFTFEHPETVDALILTASGGPFRRFSPEQMANVTVEDALKHPNWSMGAKITVDSATMMNKGLEYIEAFHLFPVTSGQIEIIIHPESVIHSMVRYKDGSLLAQMGEPSMAAPIAYAFSYPSRMETGLKKFDFTRYHTLTFETPDETRFPALRLAREALQQGGGAPIILNAANEVAVDAFLSRRIPFSAICRIVEDALQSTNLPPVESLDDVLNLDGLCRRKTLERIHIYG